MKKNTLSINIVYDSESVSIPALNRSTERKGNRRFSLTFGPFTVYRGLPLCSILFRHFYTRRITRLKTLYDHEAFQ